MQSKATLSQINPDVFVFFLPMFTVGNLGFIVGTTTKITTMVLSESRFADNSRL